MDEQKCKRAILVSGGFHTFGITKILRDAKISYMVVAPKVTDVSGNLDTYFSRLEGQATPLETELKKQIQYLAAPLILAENFNDPKRWFYFCISKALFMLIESAYTSEPIFQKTKEMLLHGTIREEIDRKTGLKTKIKIPSLIELIKLKVRLDPQTERIIAQFLNAIQMGRGRILIESGNYHIIAAPAGEQKAGIFLAHDVDDNGNPIEIWLVPREKTQTERYAPSINLQLRRDIGIISKFLPPITPKTQTSFIQSIINSIIG